jgi:antirestriction protein
MDELDGDAAEAFAAWVEHEGDYAGDLDAFRDAYAGTFDTWADFAAEYIEQSGTLEGVPENVARYFDYESFGRDMRLGGDAWEAGGHYFWSR